VATGLIGGHAANALPQTAEVRLNCRILPDAVPGEIRDGIIKALGDPAIEVSPAGKESFVEPSPLLPEMVGPVERVTKDMFGSIPVIPTMSTGATDSQPFRQIGIPSYGVSGLMGDPDDIRSHGRDERMKVKSFFDGQEFLLRLTKLLAAGKPVS
jgi:acetylornithine deacetylase/succinyl-diaminopimelate desuccinylase-like protein